MSITSDQREDEANGEAGAQADLPAARARRLVRALRVLASLSACVAIAALWSVEGARVTHDLQLAAPASARPGEQIALRGLLFRDVDAPEGPTLVTAETTVVLRDARARELAHTKLVPSDLATLDGTLRLPTSLSGAFVLEATTRYDDDVLTCRRALDVAADAAPARLHGREAGPLQQLTVGRVRPLAADPSPTPLLPRVVGGACVPEKPCRLLVWVGEPAAAISVRGDADVTVIDPPPGEQTAGIVALTLSVRGLDAEITLVAHRDGKPVAERAVRLPIGLGEVRVDAPGGSLIVAPLPLVLSPPPGRTQAIADVFVAGRWRTSRVVSSALGGDARTVLEAALIPPGIVRVQGRSDRFGGEGAGARVFYVRAPGEDDARALRRMAGEVARTVEVTDAATAGWADALPAFAEIAPQRAAAFLLAPLEQLRASVPVAVSGRPAALRQLGRTKVRLRYGVAAALVLSALVIAFSIARRGLSATDEAEGILAAGRAGSDRSSLSRGTARFATNTRERLRARALVLLFVLAVAAAFLAGALLIVAKPLWF